MNWPSVSLILGIYGVLWLGLLSALYLSGLCGPQACILIPTVAHALLLCYGLMHACPGPSRPGGRRLYEDGPSRPGGRRLYEETTRQ